MFFSLLTDNACKCPAGQYFTPSACEWCPLGSYNTMIGAQSADACVICPAGYSCATPSQLPVPCTQGQYSLINATHCINCPAGRSCANPAAAPVMCDLGQYSAANATSCSQCP